MPELVVETRRLRKEFGSKVAVNDLTLSVRQGEVFGFLGPNGAGKTTSIKMLLALVSPSAGEARVLGRPLGDVRARAKVGFLPEHFRFQDWLSAREFLQFHGQMYGVPQKILNPRIEQLLARVDLLDTSDRKLRDFSKGMLQRIGLAQALLNEPALVFLDEPTSGLDPLGRLLVRDMLNDLRAKGTAVFLNSHLLSEVEVTCDRVAFVKQGNVVREMALNERSDGFEVELKVAPLNAPLLNGLAQFGRNLQQQNGHVRMTVNSEQDLPQIARWLVQQDAQLFQLGATRKSLETVFLEVMGEDARPG
jgi:ABC-2 type transport system ATP-binding protein